MGYLDNTTVTVEAILTKKGREILSKGGTLNITKFALADDEVDYSLWQADHPLGTNYYGTIIENMPVLEATPDETQIMRFKLVTLPKTTTKMPILTVGFSSIQLGKEGDQVLIQPRTRFYENDAYGYTAIVENSNYVDLQVKSALDASVVPVVPSFLRDEELNQSLVKVGNSFTLISKNVNAYTSTYVKTNLTIVGNDSGATRTVPITVYADRIFAPATSGS
jgi:hypothetical protein